jgi:hypothetical protein
MLLICMADVMDNPGVKRKFTGAVHDFERMSAEVNSLVECCPPGVLVEVVDGTYQEANKYCAINCAALAFSLDGNPLRQDVYDQLKKKDPPLESVIDMLSQKTNGSHQSRKPKGISNVQLLAWLHQQTLGVYAVEYDGHCVVWDASKKLILDTDPRHRYPLQITDNTLSVLGR